MLRVLEKMKEEELLRRLKSGDEAAFTEVFELMSPKLFRHALYRTSSEEIAEDIVGETFMRAWEYVRENAARLTHLRAFLYRIADNLVIDHYRRKPKETVPIDDAPEKSLAVDEAAAERFDRGLLEGKMAASLKLLRDEARDLLVMRYLDELTMDEIAGLTGKTKNALYVALHRAIKELKKICSVQSSDN